ncbi:ABC transporter [Skeletonema marinoi]|uniref:ABC transporter n=1 Tax=Skeletonema marinoi TaxID=267567 RepID=A0AAD9DHE9_9STRA|nr:ABC transporter [Skeletonema marinoi]
MTETSLRLYHQLHSTMHLILTLAALVLALSSSAFELAVPARPSYVHIDKVSQQYPVTLFNKLFSSVPKREYALQDINLTFGQNDNGVILLVGRSASGKSTILRLIAGMEMPTQGCKQRGGIKYANLDQSGEIPESSEKSQPVILDGKPDFDDSLPLLERIIQMGPDDNMAQSKLLAATLSTYSVSMDKLSPSEQYLFSIACACMASVAPAIKEHNDEGSGMPYPILLLDELFDTEVPSTVEKCNKGITNLVECGAVVISATHRPITSKECQQELLRKRRKSAH